MMHALSCQGDWLVDYADDTLVGSERQAAEDHLATCDACREIVAQLRHSGLLLQRHWTHLPAEPLLVSPRSPRSARGWCGAHSAGAVATAALVLIAVALSLLQHSTKPVAQADPPSTTSDISNKDVPASANTKNTIEPAEDVSDLLAAIEREGQIARLQATIAILGQQPGTAECRERFEQYLDESYQISTGEVLPSL